MRVIKINEYYSSWIQSGIVQLNSVNKEISSLKLLIDNKDIEIESLHGEKKLLEIYNVTEMLLINYIWKLINKVKS